MKVTYTLLSVLVFACLFSGCNKDKQIVPIASRVEFNRVDGELQALNINFPYSSLGSNGDQDVLEVITDRQVDLVIQELERIVEQLKQSRGNLEGSQATAPEEVVEQESTE